MQNTYNTYCKYAAVVLKHGAVGRLDAVAPSYCTTGRGCMLRRSEGCSPGQRKVVRSWLGFLLTVAIE